MQPFLENVILNFHQYLTINILLKDNQGKEIPNYKIQKITLKSFKKPLYLHFLNLISTYYNKFSISCNKTETDNRGFLIARLEITAGCNVCHGKWIFGILIDGISSSPLTLFNDVPEISINIISRNAPQNLNLLQQIPYPIILLVMRSDNDSSIENIPIIAHFRSNDPNIFGRIDLDGSSHEN